MNELLTSEEINAILGAFCASKGSNSKIEPMPLPRKIRPYDFTNPDRFTRDQLKTIRMINSKYATSIGSSLSDMLRCSLAIRLKSCEQSTFKEFCESADKNSLSYHINPGELANNAVFEFDPAFAGICIDGLTGGGGFFGFNGKWEVTDLDKAIIRKMVKHIIEKYEDAWASYIVFSASPISSEDNYSSVNVMLPKEPVLVCTFDAVSGSVHGEFRICLSTGKLEKTLPRHIEEDILPALRPNHKPAKAISDSVDETLVPCKAVLGHTSISMEDVMNLTEGDVIKLDEKQTDGIQLWVGKNLAYTGVFGKSGNHVGVRITGSEIRD